MRDFSEVFKYARPYKKILFFSFLCLILTSVISLLLPLIVKNMVNAVFIEKSGEALNSLTIDLIITIIFQVIFNTLVQICQYLERNILEGKAILEDILQSHLKTLLVILRK